MATRWDFTKKRGKKVTRNETLRILSAVSTCSSITSENNRYLSNSFLKIRGGELVSVTIDIHMQFIDLFFRSLEVDKFGRK